MSLVIRMARAGTKKRPFYHIVVADSRSPRDGRFIERLGYFNPLLPKEKTDRLKWDLEKAKAWIAKGATPSETVESLLACATTKTVKWMFLTTSGPYLDDGRNNMVLAFNDAHLDLCDRLLMVDSDVEFTPDHVRQLEEDDLPVVAGVYHSPWIPEKPKLLNLGQV